MGGKALKQFNVSRISNDEYERRLPEFKRYAGQIKGYDFFIPGGVLGKEDHGDLDVIFCETEKHDSNEFVDKLMEMLKSEGKVKNGNCTSIEWRKFQVDLIRVKPEEFEFACNYYAHGTHAALMGRIASYYGFKLGWDGFYKRLHVGNSKVDVLLTREWSTALFTLGYSWALNPTVAYSVEDVFDHIESSTFFCKRIFESTRPDRNYGFQESFYNHVLTKPDGRNYSKSYGWLMLSKVFPSMVLPLMFKNFSMQFNEFVRPLKRSWRKFRYTVLMPLAFKLRGWL